MPAPVPPPVGSPSHRLSILLLVGIAPFYFNGLYNPPLYARDPPLFWAAEFVAWTVVPVTVLALSLRHGLISRIDLGLHTRVGDRPCPKLLLLLTLAAPFVFLPFDQTVTRWAYDQFPANHWARPSFSYNAIVPPPGPDTGWRRILVLVYLCGSAACVEEFYYRALFGRLFPARGLRAAAAYVLTSSPVFAGAHWERGLPALVEAFAFGLLASIFFRSTRNLYPLLLAHFLCDWYWLSR